MKRTEQTHKNDLITKALVDSGRLKVDAELGLMFAVQSKTPAKPVGAPNARGYLRTCITTKGRAHSVMVHRAIWIAAHGVPAEGWQINHKDGVKTNNALANLELVTPAANNEHARSAGLWKPVSGLANGFAKMSDEQVAAVVNYVRTHFGDGYKDAVTPEDVKGMRQ